MPFGQLGLVTCQDQADVRKIWCLPAKGIVDQHLRNVWLLQCSASLAARADQAALPPFETVDALLCMIKIQCVRSMHSFVACGTICQEALGKVPRVLHIGRLNWVELMRKRPSFAGTMAYKIIPGVGCLVDVHLHE